MEGSLLANRCADLTEGYMRQPQTTRNTRTHNIDDHNRHLFNCCRAAIGAVDVTACASSWLEAAATWRTYGMGYLGSAAAVLDGGRGRAAVACTSRMTRVREQLH